MKVTIELTAAQVKGLKEYLKDISGDINPKVTKKDIEQEIKGMVALELQCGAVYDYISKYEKLYEETCDNCGNIITHETRINKYVCKKCDGDTDTNF
jgi:predicted SprT family Zn-dependent metalloprotease